MTVVITYIRIRENNKIFILLNINCDAEIFLVEKNKKIKVRIFSVCDKSVIFLMGSCNQVIQNDHSVKNDSMPPLAFLF